MHRCNCRVEGCHHETEFDSDFLLRMAKRGDPAALGRLLERYRNYIALLVRLQLGCRSGGKNDFDEHIQEIWQEIGRRAEQFEGTSEREFLAWVGVVIRAVLIRAARRDLGAEGLDPRNDSPLGVEPDPSSLVLNVSLFAKGAPASRRAVERDQAVLLADALQELPEDYREVIILRQLEGLSFPDVACRLGRTEESVKSVWLRALARLRSTLEGLR